MADYNNGSVTVTVTGGQPSYTYTLLELIGSTYVTVPDNEYTSPAWGNPATVSSTTYTFGNNAGPDQNTDINVTGIRPGTYKVRIVDAGGCELLTDPIVVNEFQIGGSTACVTFETVTPALAPQAWTLEATAPTTSANDDGNITAYIPNEIYNGGFNDSEITVTATLAGGGSFNLPANGGEISNSYLFSDTPAALAPGTYTVVATVPSEGCTRSLGNVVIPSFAVQSIDITGVTFSSGGSTVSPSNLVVGTPYTVTVNSTSSNLNGVPQFVVSVSGTSNVTISPSSFSTNNTFTVTINAAGTFTLTALANDNADSNPADSFSQTITVATSGGGGSTGTTLYYFHGGATNVGWPHTVGGAMTNANATYYTQSDTSGNATLSDAMTFVLDNYGDGLTAVPDFLGGGNGYFIRNVEFAAGTTLLNDGNAGTSTQLTFDAIDNGDYCYIAVPQVTGFTDDLAANPGNILYAGNALSGANAIQKKAFTWNGQQYMLFSINALGTPSTQQSITIDN